jgi:hypothetical protein
MLKVTIDTKDLDKVLDRLLESVDRISDKALMEMGDGLLSASSKEVPHDEGTLQASGVVEPVRDGVEVGYHTPYAARLHEHPEYRFQKGRKGKYLEDPLKHNLSRWLSIYAAELESLL